MRAIVRERYGPPDVLALREVPAPRGTEGRVVIRVHAASVNALDWRSVRADPFVVRLSEGLRRPKEPRLGVDAAGVVEEVGPGVTDLRPGDEVFGLALGAFGELASGTVFVRKPPNLSFEEAAAVPVAATTALQAMRDKGGVKAGQRVLVTGAGGGVGTFAVQIACAFGAEVTAATSTDKVDLVRAIGADHVIDYRREDVTAGGRRFDTILDVAGTPSIGRLRKVLADDGTYVLVGAGHGRGGPVARLIAAFVRQKLLRQRVVFFISKENRADLQTLADMLADGRIRPVIDRTYPLEQTAQAVRYVETGQAAGKVVITVP
jgi:NADPH:quinone reductase-like Zn-dependent oxidoreductase